MIRSLGPNPEMTKCEDVKTTMDALPCDHMTIYCIAYYCKKETYLINTMHGLQMRDIVKHKKMFNYAKCKNMELMHWLLLTLRLCFHLAQVSIRHGDWCHLAEIVIILLAESQAVHWASWKPLNTEIQNTGISTQSLIIFL